MNLHPQLHESGVSELNPEPALPHLQNGNNDGHSLLRILIWGDSSGLSRYTSVITKVLEEGGKVRIRQRVEGALLPTLKGREGATSQRMQAGCRR